MPSYKVVGSRAVAGVEPGGQVELPDEEAAWLIEVGHLEVIAARKTQKIISETSEDG